MIEKDLARLYSALGALRDRVGGYRYLRDCTARSGWPPQGLYIFLDESEPSHVGAGIRVVRIGTHAVSTTSKTTLWSRLRQHRGQIGGSRPGGGNHRGSIFRLHVGAALLNSGTYSGDVRASWGMGGTAPRPVLEREHLVEQAVSNYIGSLPMLWLTVIGSPEQRAWLERNLIGLLSEAARQALATPSGDWLGNYSERREIRSSGLWNINCLDHHYDSAVVDAMAEQINRTPTG